MKYLNLGAKPLRKLGRRLFSGALHEAAGGAAFTSEALGFFFGLRRVFLEDSLSMVE